MLWSLTRAARRPPRWAALRLLLLHAKRFRYRAVKPALKQGYEELDGVKGEGGGENVLVAFVTVEDVDRENIDDVVEQAAEDIAGIASRVGASGVIVYPYAHLSPRLAPPDVALEALKRLEERLRSMGLSVVRAPFGWYKEFEIHCYGHPLAELSREFRPRGVRQRRVERRYLVVTPEGERYEPEEYLKRGDVPEDLRRLIEKEALGAELGEVETPVLRYCRKFGFEWEPYSDYGHMRYQPHATVILEAVSRYSWMVAQRLGIPVLRIRGTNMFDLAVPAVREHAELFGDRLYDLWADRKHLVLRYAACHQQFAIMKDMVLSYRDLPLGMFEVADSYRFEQTGELTLCFRLRKFHMPDLHVYVWRRVSADVVNVPGPCEPQLPLNLRELHSVDHDAPAYVLLADIPVLAEHAAEVTTPVEYRAAWDEGRLLAQMAEPAMHIHLVVEAADAHLPRRPVDSAAPLTEGA